ncbi:MAG: trypsin-like peptidase domain-containing protein [Acidobacteriota bacterium]|jgi:serine protease Do|nr:trypsin-like peptidase domain-containing protein [Acidobacteriota bacterium]
MDNQPENGGRSRKKVLLGFLMVLVVLGVGIGIGSLITGRAGATGPGDSKLEMQPAGKPVGGALQAFSQAFEDVANHVEPAVVNINTEAVVPGSRGMGGDFEAPDMGEDDPMDMFRRFFGGPGGAPFSMPDQMVRSLGSGVIVDPKGYIVTNHHVVDGATRIKVGIGGGSEEYAAKVVGADPISDIAVIKIEGAKPFPYVKVGNSKSMKVGDWVMAIGSPFGLEQTVTVGIISATGRTFAEGDGPSAGTSFNDYLQTDAAINQGNSGGPLVNMSGEVVGINSFITSRSGGSAGIGFAVPAHIFVNVYNQILETGKVSRGWIGVSMNNFPFTPEMAEFFGVKQGSGVLVTQLVDEAGKPSDTAGPAAKAGIKAEDVIVDFDGAKITDVQGFRMAVANAVPGRTVKVKVVRHGVEKAFDVVLAERTIENQEQGKKKESYSFEEDPAPKPKAEIGLEFDNVPGRVARALDIPGGAKVTSVKPGSLADDAGLSGANPRADGGDIIIAVNGKPVTNRDDLLTLVKGVKGGAPIVIKFLRYAWDRGENQYVSSPYYTSIVKP